MRGLKYLLYGAIRVGIIIGIINLIELFLLQGSDQPVATTVQVGALFLLAVGTYARLLMLVQSYIGE